jgi:hypothetical protein
VQDVKLSSTDKKELLGEERAKVKEEELTEEEKAKLAELIADQSSRELAGEAGRRADAVKEIVTEDGAEPVFVSAGKVYKLSGEDAVETFEHAAAEPYMWKFAHDVRPARQSLGVKGCYDCHTLGAPLFESTVTAVGQTPTMSRLVSAMHEMAGYDKMKIDAWALSFISRTAFKYFAYAAMGVLSLVLLAYVLRGITTVFSG